MNLHDAEQLAKRLMVEFGIGQWRFKFDKAKRRFGAAHRGARLITLSREMVLINDQAQVEDIIRHEIAHALCPPHKGHGETWKRMCVVTGAKPLQYCTDDVNTVKGDWRAVCGVCGREFDTLCRPKSDYFCATNSCMHSARPRGPLVWRNINAIFDPTEYATNVLGELKKAKGNRR